jgi:hypothetical protein
MKIIINEHQYKFILSEFMGTVDTDKFIPILEKFLEEKGVFIVFIDKTEKNEIFLDVKITNLNVSSFSEILEFLKIYNWFISYYEINYKEDNEYNSKIFNSFKELFKWVENIDEEIEFNGRVSLILEKKYTEKNESQRTFYHVTDIKNLEKIMKFGLRPRKSQNKLFYYPERIYLANDVKTIHTLNNIFKSPESKSNYGSEGTVIFEITLPNSIKTYNDPRAPNSSYVVEPIHPKYIEIYDYQK